MANPKYVSARGGEKNSVIYVAADGSEYLHSGGSRAWRNNNPGNLIAAEKSGLAIGKGGRFAVFPDHKTGLAALKFVLNSVYGTTRLDDVFAKYAPSSDNNDPERYIKLVKQYSGLDSKRKVSDLNEAELDKFMAAIQRVEGWIEGKIELIPHAQQFAVNAVDGKPLPGVDYIISFFNSKGEEKKVQGKTDDQGRTDVVVTDSSSQVSLKLPRPDPGQSLKGTGAKAKGSQDKKVEAACVRSKPWYGFAFSKADECLTEAAENAKAPTAKQDPPAQKPKDNSASKPAEAPVAVVKQQGAVKASATVDKSANYIAKITKEPGVFITWLFDTSGGSGKPLRGLPYFIALMDGDKASPLYEGQRVQILTETNKIRQKIPFGKEVALFLGSDAKAKYRKQPLYRVEAEDGFTDIVVTIKETRGRQNDESREIPALVDDDGGKKKFEARLFGSTWLKFSHKFSAAEAEELTKDASSEVQNAVKKIYNGETTVSSAAIILDVLKKDNSTMRIMWPRSAFSNCIDNVAAISDLESAKQEAILRVNPNTYQAFIQAAFEMNAQELEVNSGWRPMLGSVLHRIGVGLDVGRIKVAGSNRVFRRSATTAETEYSDLKKEKKTLLAKKVRTPEEEKRLNSIKNEEPDAAKKALDAISANEHSDLKTFTTKLRANSEVRQTFDPWQMEDNTADQAAPTTNKLSTGNEVLHKTHLHITVFDEELGHGR